MKRLLWALALAAIGSSNAQAGWVDLGCQENPIDDSKTCGSKTTSDSGERLLYACDYVPGEERKLGYIHILVAEGRFLSVGKSGDLHHVVRMRGDEKKPFQVAMMTSRDRNALNETGLLKGFAILHISGASKLVVEMPYYEGNKFAFFDLTERDGQMSTIEAQFKTDGGCREN